MSTPPPPTTPAVGYLVDGTALLSTVPDPAAVDATIDSLLLAQRTKPTDPASLSEWPQAYIETLVNLGWNAGSTTNGSSTPGAAGAAAVAGFVPWQGMREALAADVSADVLAQLDQLMVQVPPAPPDQAEHWKASTVSGTVAAAAVAVLGQDSGGDYTLTIAFSSVAYTGRHARPVPAFPTATLPDAADLQTNNATAQLVGLAATITGMPAQLDPLVQAAKAQVVTISL